MEIYRPSPALCFSHSQSLSLDPCFYDGCKTMGVGQKSETWFGGQGLMNRNLRPFSTFLLPSSPNDCEENAVLRNCLQIQILRELHGTPAPCKEPGGSGWEHTPGDAAAATRPSRRPIRSALGCFCCSWSSCGDPKAA